MIVHYLQFVFGLTYAIFMLFMAMRNSNEPQN